MNRSVPAPDARYARRMDVLDQIGQGLWNAFQMAWEVWWALVLGFLLSGIVQAWVPRTQMARALGGRGPRSLALATGLGAASSSCSYPAAAIPKSAFQQGAGFVALLPLRVFNDLFLTHTGGAGQLLENVLVGPVVAVLSFVCSVGNVPLAAVLWAGGISFGGVIAFIYADLIIIPLVVVYARYYGVRIAALLV